MSKTNRTNKTEATGASETPETKRRPRMTVSLFVLQVVAMMTMTMDHLARSFLEQGTLEWMTLTTIGRVAFLLYAFMIAECFHHVKNSPTRIRTHLRKLVILALVSEIPFDLMGTGQWIDLTRQSVMLTLLLGFVGLMVIERNRGGRTWPVSAYYLASVILSWILHLDYCVVGIPLVAFFGWFTESFRDASLCQRLGVLMLGITAYHFAYIWLTADFGTWDQFVEMFAYYRSRIIGHYGTMLLVAAYGGARGHRGKWYGRLYSAYYPLHMAVIDAVMLLG